MNINDAFEVSYKNGYEKGYKKGKVDATEHTKARLIELYDDISYDTIYHNCPSVETIRERLKDILEEL